MARLAPLDLDQLQPEQRAVADASISGPRGGLRGPFEAWLLSPELADRAQKLGEYCRFGTSLPRDLSEFAILLTGKHWKGPVLSSAHAALTRAKARLPLLEQHRGEIRPNTRHVPPYRNEAQQWRLR